MATGKTYAVAGVSTLNGKTKIRFANDATRIKILIKNSHRDVELVDLPREMTKGEIADYLREIGFSKGRSSVEQAIADLADKNKTAEKQPKRSVATVAETQPA